MKTHKTRNRLLTTTMIGGFAALAMAVPAMAQTAPQTPPQEEAELDEIIVTGSRIARSNFTSESPVTVVTGEQISNSGQVGLGEVLRQELASTPSGGFNQSSNLSGGGAQSVDLRGLGSDRVLTMINGRRVANFADALQNEAADLGFIPLAMVSRIEILRDGASAVYGADAVTGVVNIILKDDFEGFDVSVQAGISDYGDYETYQIQTVMGGNFERGNAVFGLEYAKTEMVLQREREWAIPTIGALFATGVVNGSGAHPGGTISFPAAGILPARTWCTRPIALGGDERTNVAGTPQCPSSAPSSPFALIGRYDYALQQSILNGSENLNAAFYGNFRLTDTITAFTEFQFADRLGNSVLDGNPIFAGSGSVAFPGGWVVPASNPYNPFPGQRGLVTQRPTSTVGPRNQEVNAQSVRFVTGLRGEIAQFDWELSYINTEVNASVDTNATFNLARAIRISDPALCAADPICTAALKPGSLGALDVYRPANWSESEIAYIRQRAISNSEFTLEGVSGVISGDVFELPAGPVGVALGFDYREEEVSINPDAVTAAGESVANQTFPTAGGFNVGELYTEVNLPLLRDVFLAQDVSLNLQYRYFDYSNFGSDDVYKVGYNHRINDWVRLRATYGTSFRQPTLVDVFSGGTVGFDFIFDPCDNNGGLVTDTSPEAANARVNCASAGPLGVPSPATFTQSAAQLPVLGGGDLADGTFDLLPETAETATVGLLFSPTLWGERLEVALDYWSIEVDNFIGSTDVQSQVLDPCFGSAGFSAPECATLATAGIRRDPVTGQLQGLVESLTNFDDRLETAGIDWAVRYAIDMGNARLSLDHQGTYVTDYNLLAGGAGTYSGTSGNVFPEYRLNFGANLEFSDYAVGLQARYTPSVDDTSVRGNGNNVLSYDKIDDLLIIDARMRWNPTDTTSLLFGINNLFNEDPPYVFNTGSNSAPGLHSSAVVGRYFFLRASKSF